MALKAGSLQVVGLTALANVLIVCSKGIKKGKISWKEIYSGVDRLNQAKKQYITTN